MLIVMMQVKQTELFCVPVLASLQVNFPVMRQVKQAEFFFRAFVLASLPWLRTCFNMTDDLFTSFIGFEFLFTFILCECFLLGRYFILCFLFFFNSKLALM
uniref:Uncharacterized protein n=1 Tax=Cacopsylla melanoneura TaxID=428564 RepID=A0A8D8RZS5_9HEMI